VKRTRAFPLRQVREYQRCLASTRAVAVQRLIQRYHEEQIDRVLELVRKAIEDAEELA
jgi:hypothetical protein